MQILPTQARGYWFVALLTIAGCQPGTDAPTTHFEVAAKGIHAGAIDEAGERMLVGSLYHGASLWRLTDKERLFDWRHQESAYAELAAAAVSADGRFAVTTEPRNLILWDVESGQSLGYWGSPSGILDVVAASDGRTIVLALEDHSGLVFDAVSGDYLATLQHAGVVYSVALDRAATKTFTTSEDNTAKLWAMPHGDLIHTFDHESPVRVGALALSDNWAFTASQDGVLSLWDTQQGTLAKQLAMDRRGVTAARFVDDDTRLLIGFANGFIESWSLPQGTRQQRLQVPLKQPYRATGNAIAALGYNSNRAHLLALVGDGQFVAYPLE